MILFPQKLFFSSFLRINSTFHFFYFDIHIDASCTVCGISTDFDDNPIVLCDGCNAAVHKQCYDITSQEMEQDKWFCKPCRFEYSSF